MVAKQEFLVLIERVVAQVAPSEQMAFSLSGQQLADALYSGGDANLIEERRPSEFQFLDTATQVLQFVGLMIGTFTAIQKLLKTLRPRDPHYKEVLTSEWKKELQEQGMPEKTATEVATHFGDELAAALGKTQAL